MASESDNDSSLELRSESEVLTPELTESIITESLNE